MHRSDTSYSGNRSITARKKWTSQRLDKRQIEQALSAIILNADDESIEVMAKDVLSRASTKHLWDLMARLERIVPAVIETGDSILERRPDARLEER
jgi:hypothetical protein